MQSLRACAVIAIALFAVACKDKQSKPSGDPEIVEPVDPDAVAPTLRLDDRAEPTAYRVRLAIDPAAETFNGTVDIDMRLHQSTKTLWMHQRDLDLKEVALTGAEMSKVRIERTEPGLLGLHFDKALPAGDVSLMLRYSGKIVRRDGVGIFAEREGDDWYQFTQFEALDARRAFPCFDEPRWKVPWTLTLDVAEDLVAVSNTPVESEKPMGNGIKRVTFMQTKALPTYLVAFAVGPFEMLDAGKSASGVPMRMIATRGRSAEAAYAAKVTPEILTRLEAYFGRPYPYRKLDTLMIPTTQGFGAMEHPGLITFSGRLALWAPDQETYVRRQIFSLVQAHEIGHQWFGNLVTMPWWDDIWLNEAFASWIENRVLDVWRPEWKLAATSVGSKEEAMVADSLGSARRIREPIKTEEDIDSAFDDITYLKGEAVINMFESWVGPEVWQKGIQAYLTKHEWKTATASDLLAAIGEVAGKDVATPFNTFLDQNGLPLVQMKLRCAEGEAPTLELSQTRYLPIASRAPAARRWHIPVCVTHTGGEACTVLSEKSATLALGEAGARCPTWVNPNKGGVGYYRAQLSDESRGALLEAAAKKLSLPERLSLIYDIGALVRSGGVTAWDGFAVAADLARDREPLLVLAGIELVLALEPLVADEWRESFAAKVREVYGPVLARIGWGAKRREAPQMSELRPALIWLLGAYGEDPEIIAKASEMTAGHFAGTTALAPELAGKVLGLAARNGDAKLLETMMAKAATEPNRHQRRHLLRAIGQFRGEHTAAALAFALSEDIDSRDGGRIIETAAAVRANQTAVLDLLEKSYDTIAGRLSESQLGGLPSDLAGFCDPAQRRKLATLLTDRMAKVPGGATSLKKALEKIDLCIALRKAQSDSLKKAVVP